VQQQLEDEYVKIRSARTFGMTESDFGRLINIARIYSNSLGESELSLESWNICYELVKEA